MDRDYRIVDAETRFDVYIDGKFYCSRDTFEAAVREAERYYRMKEWVESSENREGGN